MKDFMQIIGVSQANSKKSTMSVLPVFFDQYKPDCLKIANLDHEQVWSFGMIPGG
jgi:hypothetical protein